MFESSIQTIFSLLIIPDSKGFKSGNKSGREICQIYQTILLTIQFIIIVCVRNFLFYNKKLLYVTYQPKSRKRSDRSHQHGIKFPDSSPERNVTAIKSSGKSKFDLNQERQKLLHLIQEANERLTRIEQSRNKTTNKPILPKLPKLNQFSGENDEDFSTTESFQHLRKIFAFTSMHEWLEELEQLQLKRLYS